MLKYLSKLEEFPPVEQALDEPNGLLAAGADLSAKRLLSAYTRGIFPWFSDDEPILWWSPDPRTIIDISSYKPSRSLIRFVKSSKLKVTLNKDFNATILECAEPREDQLGTWITNDIIKAYKNLHNLKKAHSIEVWQDGLLVGGIYGVSIGRLFCGESMFSRISNGSKVALSCLIGYLKQFGFPIIDCQVQNPHLSSLGATGIRRKDFINIVNNSSQLNVDESIWLPQELDYQSLISRKASD